MVDAIPDALRGCVVPGRGEAVTLRFRWSGDAAWRWGLLALVASVPAGWPVYLAAEAWGLPPVGQEDSVTLFLAVVGTVLVLPGAVFAVAWRLAPRSTVVRVAASRLVVGYRGGPWPGFDLPFSAIDRVERDGSGLWLHTQDGGRLLRLPATGPRQEALADLVRSRLER